MQAADQLFLNNQVTNWRTRMNKKSLNKIPCTMFLLAFLCLSTTGSSISCTVKNTAGSPDPNPVDLFDEYWSLAKAGKLKELKEKTTTAPSVFYDCKVLSSTECIKLKKSQDKTAKESSDGLGDSMTNMNGDPYSKIKVSIPIFIQEEKWKSYLVRNRHQDGNEAKLTIEVEQERSKESLDVFLFREKGEWKIFEIETAGVYEAYAESPVK